MIPRRLEEKLSLTFTGGVIIDNKIFEFEADRIVLIIFKDGSVVNYLPGATNCFHGEELEGWVVNWLIEFGYDCMQIYADCNNFVTSTDYDKLIGMEARFKLMENMNCVVAN